MLKTFRTAISGSNKIPDPLKIYSVYEWYILDAVSENLVRYDNHSAQYLPAIASEWEFNSSGLVLKINEGLFFNDGTPLTADDVLQSFQRIIRNRTSTHYPIWEHIEGCSRDNCSGLRVEGSNLIIDYRGDKESLFMFLSSPEGAIWSSSDVAGADFNPRRYSGFYFPISINEDGIIMRKNRYNARANSFPNAPDEVHIKNLSSSDSALALGRNELDAVLISKTPFRQLPIRLEDFKIHQTIPISLNYLLKVGNSNIKPFSSSFLKAIWSHSTDRLAVSSYGILPPGVQGVLTREESLQAIGEKNPSADLKHVKVGIFSPYHSEEFGKIIADSALKSGFEVQLVKIGKEQFFETIKNPHASNLDYLLSSYVASDKFPLTQLRLMLNHHDAPFDFYTSLEHESDAIRYLKEIQTHILKEQLLIPLFYAPDVILAQPCVDLGNQPTTDTELQIWRINENSSAN